MNNHSALPWTACGGGECPCGKIWSKTNDHPVATVVSGEWGDDFPTLKWVDGTTSIGRQVEAVMEKIVYGSVSESTATANAALIVRAVNSHDAVTSALSNIVENFKESSVSADDIAWAEAALKLAKGEA